MRNTRKAESAQKQGLPLLRWLTALVCTVGLWPSAASAQLFQRPTVIENARVVVGDRVIEPAMIILRGDRIASVRGPGAEAPERANVIDAAGGAVTPALIDAWGGLALSPSADGEDAAAAMAHEMFDPYADVLIRDALRNGVGTVYVSARGAAIAGTGSIIRLKPRDSGGYGEVVREVASVCVDLRADTPAERLARLSGVRQALRSALDYRETAEVYEDSLETYLEELKKLKDESDEYGDDEDSESETAEDDGKDEDADDDEKKDSGPAKPERPRTDRNAERLLQVHDREIPLRIRADRSADILNALEIGDEFNIDIIIEGGAESGLVASAIAEHEATVVLAPQTTPVFDRETRRPTTPDVAALDAAGVTWTVGGGVDSARASRGVLLAAKSLAGRSDKADAMGLVTRRAGEVLGLEGAGAMRPGAIADLVLWSGEPGAPGSRVMRMWLDGATVYER